jgi:hypothetical protein
LSRARNAGDDSPGGAAQLAREPREKNFTAETLGTLRREKPETSAADKTKAGQLFGCPAFYFLEASFEPEARIGSAHNYQELSPREKARRKFTSQLNSLIHL